MDAGHKKRLKILAQEMIRAVEALDLIQERMLELYITENPECEWHKDVKTWKDFSSDIAEVERISTEMSAAKRVEQSSETWIPAGVRSSDKEGDLIDIHLRA